MDLGLQGKKAIVTGASRGIGRCIANALAGEGVDLAICSRSPEGLEEARKDLEGRGVRVVAQALDVADGDALKQWIDAAAGDLGGHPGRADGLEDTREFDYLGGRLARYDSRLDPGTRTALGGRGVASGGKP